MEYNEKVSTVTIDGIDIYLSDLHFSLKNFLRQNKDKYDYKEGSKGNAFPYVLTIYEKDSPRRWEIRFYKNYSGSYFLVEMDTPFTINNSYTLSTNGIDDPNVSVKE